MDLRLVADAEPTPSERDALDDVLGPPGSRWEGSRTYVPSGGDKCSSGNEDKREA